MYGAIHTFIYHWKDLTHVRLFALRDLANEKRFSISAILIGSSEVAFLDNGSLKSVMFDEPGAFVGT